MKPKKHKPTRQNAPRLPTGRRVNFTIKLPGEMKQGFKEIAKDEKRSVSWVAQRIYYEFFGLPLPERKQRRKREKR